jgi:signal transduction histidine kinase/ligand-binding sensor domain-containing protein/DNA-binding response OmpR family regulator
MINRFLQSTLPALLLVCSYFVVLAQPKPVTYLGIENGLSNNSVTSIFQDHYGFLWFGTYDGLNRYNGYEFKVFRNQLNDPTSLIHNRIVAITEDADNRIWIGTKMGVSIYDPVKSVFSGLKYKSSQGSGIKNIDFTINDLHADKSGNVYIATAGKGLLYYKRGAAYAIQLNGNTQGSEAGNTHIQSIKVDKQHRLWAFIQGWGLYLLDRKSNSLRLVSNAVTMGNVLETDNLGNLYLGTDIGLYSYNIKENTFVYHTAVGNGLTGGTKVVGLTLDKVNQLWVATDGSGIGVLSLQTKKVNFLRYGEEKGQLKSAAVYAVFEDKDARKWIGTLRGGINVVDPHQLKFTNRAHDKLNTNSLINNFVLSFCENQDGNLWIGTDGGGLSFWDKKKNRYRNYKHEVTNKKSLVNDNVTNILEDHEHRIWISTYGGGICRYNPETDDFERFDCYNGIYKYLNNNVWLLFQDRHRNMLAGTVDGAVYCFNRATNKFEVYDNSLMNVISLAEDSKGNLWAGTFAGLIRVDPTHKNHQLFKTDYPVRAIHEDKYKQLWIGTEGGGFLHFNPIAKKFKAYTTLNGLSSNSILNILEDRKGLLWLSTFNGISRFNPLNKKVKSYYEADGLQSNQFNYNAALVTANGELLFGGIKGYTAFHPDSLKGSAILPKLLFSGIKINNKPYEQENSGNKNAVYDLRKIVLPYDSTMLSVDFLALDYAAKGNISYAYKLEGWDSDWNYIGKSRVANYSRLKEGSYLLKIKSTNPEGVWNTAEKTIEIVVLPPWFRTWWAYLIYALAGSGIIYAYLHYKSRQAALLYEVKITHYQAEKEKEIQERKLAFFTNVAHEFRSPLTLIVNPIKDFIGGKEKLTDPSQLNIVYRNAKRLLSLVDQLLLFTRTESMEDELTIAELNCAALCEDVFLCFVQQAKSKNISYELDCEQKEISIFGDREKIEIILFNLISNALKFAPEGGYVKISVKESGNDVGVKISNNGPEIPAEAGAKLFTKFYQVKKEDSALRSGFGIGLYLVKSFVERHSGQIRYDSTPAETSFSVDFKKGKDHFSGLSITRDTDKTSYLFSELLADVDLDKLEDSNSPMEDHALISHKQSILVIDDNREIRDYLKILLTDSFRIHEAESAENGLAMVKENLPDLIICDVMMQGMDGIEFCGLIKKDKSTSHIPVILLTGTGSGDIKMRGFAQGADDYITKPFENDMLITRVNGILKRQQDLQQYFFNRITLKPDQLKISTQHKEFLDRCIDIVEQRLSDNNFNISILAAELGMSHSSLYKQVKFLSGQSISAFIRFIRLRKAAELFIRTSHNVNEVAFEVGFSDIKYFREQFNKLFGYKPSEYIRKYRTTFNQSYHVNERPFMSK